MRILSKVSATMVRIALFIICFCSVSTVWGFQPGGYPGGPILPGIISDDTEESPAFNQDLARILVKELGLEKELKSAYMSHLTRYKEVMEEQRKAIRTQQSVYWVIFVVTHLVLGVGVIASIVEFRSSYQARNTANSESEVRISLEGVALKTSLHGTLLLGMTIGFYFLYLAFVFPIVRV